MKTPSRKAVAITAAVLIIPGFAIGAIAYLAGKKVLQKLKEKKK